MPDKPALACNIAVSNAITAFKQTKSTDQTPPTVWYLMRYVASCAVAPVVPEGE